jgi:hypothetical protein
MMSRRRAGIAIAALAVLVLSGAAAAVAASATSAPTAEALAAQFDLSTSPIAADAPAPAVGLTAAESAAIDAAGVGDLVASEHVRVYAGPDFGIRSAWVFFFTGGDPNTVPWGPAGNKAPTVSYSGVIVDDQTGQVLMWLRTGHV